MLAILVIGALASVARCKSLFSPRQIRLALGERPDGITVVWTTHNATTRPCVEHAQLRGADTDVLASFNLADDPDVTCGSSRAFVDPGLNHRVTVRHSSPCGHTSVHFYICVKQLDTATLA